MYFHRDINPSAAVTHKNPLVVLNTEHQNKVLKTKEIMSWFYRGLVGLKHIFLEELLMNISVFAKSTCKYQYLPLLLLT